MMILATTSVLSKRCTCPKYLLLQCIDQAMSNPCCTTVSAQSALQIKTCVSHEYDSLNSSTTQLDFGRADVGSSKRVPVGHLSDATLFVMHNEQVQLLHPLLLLVLVNFNYIVMTMQDDARVLLHLPSPIRTFP